MKPIMQPEEEAPQPNPAKVWRVERYLELGFTEVDANLLADAKDAKGFSVYWADVRDKLNLGCTHTQALAIYA